MKQKVSSKKSMLICNFAELPFSFDQKYSALSHWFFWTMLQTFRFLQMQWVPWLPEWLLASQELLCCWEFLNTFPHYDPVNLIQNMCLYCMNYCCPVLFNIFSKFVTNFCILFELCYLYIYRHWTQCIVEVCICCWPYAFVYLFVHGIHKTHLLSWY